MNLEQVIIKSELQLSDLELLYDTAEEVIYKKGHHLVQQGEICQHIYFVESGLLRIYYNDAKGNDITHWFSTEKQFCTITQSFFDKKISNYSIEAIEATKVRQVTVEQLHQLCNQSRAIERFIRLVLIQLIGELSDKVVNTQFLTAKERYLILIEQFPDIFNSVNLGHIASYIGVTLSTLSRIRAEKL